ncbi:IclR family transcriptional regulator [Paracraurococcus ruber]|uniref:IclR family transcriptional regulator n=1 Tax=Paracraurococcus ruber TaxID=77675 RepID=A0ABS1D3J6_9PROT|nr:IclR family transcriptional regulator [Paracraurococcus ruber]MBK1661243.1 hypothetical protein [Paracraurococcus ruber]TDG30247.1 IclR family transcriptional regulator [Paracraurococcus ruber]
MLEPPRTDAAAPAQAGVNAVEVAGGLVRALADAAGPQRLADLARAVGMPTAKAHRYLVSLMRAGLVAQDPQSRCYDLGPLALRAGLVALGRSDALKQAERVLEALAGSTGETAAVAVWGTHGPTLVRLAAARHAQAARVPPGHVFPLTWSACGLVFCAWDDPARIAPLAARDLAQSRAIHRPGAPHGQAELDALVATARARGFATAANEAEGGVSAIAAPVLDSGGGRLRLALSVFGGAGRINLDPDGPVAALVLDAARRLAAELRGHPPLDWLR